MTVRLGLRLLALALPAALLAPAAANAEKVVTEDPAADVLALGPTEQGGDDLDNLLPAPENLTADVVRTTVDHRASRLRVRLDLRDLGRSRTYFAVLELRTPDGRFTVETENLGRRPKADLRRRSRAIECRSLRAAGDQASSRVTVTIPTSCLDDPRWVQVGAGVASVETVTSADGAEEMVVVADDAHRAGEVRERIALGPKVRRG
jgi:hypothetical protein